MKESFSYENQISGFSMGKNSSHTNKQSNFNDEIQNLLDKKFGIHDNKHASTMDVTQKVDQIPDDKLNRFNLRTERKVHEP